MDNRIELIQTRKNIAQALGCHLQDAVVFTDADMMVENHRFAIIVEAPWKDVVDRLVGNAKERLPKEAKILDIEVFVSEYDIGNKLALALRVWVEK